MQIEYSWVFDYRNNTHTLGTHDTGAAVFIRDGNWYLNIVLNKEPVLWEHGPYDRLSDALNYGEDTFILAAKAF